MSALEALKAMSKAQVRVTAFVSAMSLVAGAAAGAAIAMKKLESKLRTEYDEILVLEIAQAKKYFAALNKKEEFATPAEAADALLGPAVEALKSYSGSDVAQLEQIVQTAPRPGLKEISRNVFTDATLNQEYLEEQEIKKRDPSKPYVVTEEEVAEVGPEWETITLTYYAGGDQSVLTDDQDVPIDNIDELVGFDNLTKWGFGNSSNEIVYVRNEKLHCDYEIALSERSYVEDVIGLQHSDRRELRRFRDSDD